MLKVASRTELHAITGGKAPEPAAPKGPDATEVIAQALRHMTETMAQAMAQMAVMQSTTAAQIANDKPIRLEADIERDKKTGKMTKIIIIPVRQL